MSSTQPTKIVKGNSTRAQGMLESLERLEPDGTHGQYLPGVFCSLTKGERSIPGGEWPVTVQGDLGLEPTVQTAWVRKGTQVGCGA